VNLRDQFREARSEVLIKSEELKEERLRRATLERRVETLEGSLTTPFRQKEKEDLEFQLATSRRELREATADLVAKQQSLVEERKHSDTLQARIQTLESAYASVSARQTDLSRDASLASAACRQIERAERALDEERHHSTILSQHVENLETSLKTASLKEEQLKHEAEVYKARGDYQELVNNQIRHDVEEAISAPSSPTRRLGLGISPALSAVTSPPVSPQSARLDYPKASSVRRLRKEVLTARSGDRTSAISRYDPRGHLISYDSLGRPI